MTHSVKHALEYTIVPTIVPTMNSEAIVWTCRTSGLDEEAFGQVHNAIRRGDLVGVKGYPGKSKRGELSVFPTSFIVLAPCLHMLPKYRLDNQVHGFAFLLLLTKCFDIVPHGCHWNKKLHVPCCLYASV